MALTRPSVGFVATSLLLLSVQIEANLRGETSGDATASPSVSDNYCAGKSSGDYCLITCYDSSCSGHMLITCRNSSVYQMKDCSVSIIQPSGAKQTCIQTTTGSYYNAECGTSGAATASPSVSDNYCAGMSSGDYCLITCYDSSCSGHTMITCRNSSVYQMKDCSVLISQPSGVNQTCIQTTKGSYYNAECGSK